MRNLQPHRRASGWALAIALLALALAGCSSGPPQPPNPGGSPAAGSVSSSGAPVAISSGPAAGGAGSPPELGGVGGAPTPAPLARIRYGTPASSIQYFYLTVAQEEG